ncbi:MULTISPECIES: hypothetical protein [unclassified Clostridium]|uniref:homocitrate synthase/isopropylmalate synthase family protein n=1 Tax=unclassified Clostridium TaxID=2614128 RepID=UPI00029805E3|nr:MULTISPECIES: hypothetical protein [unclassified Clostridium]EKQ52385.1 MAG: hypothetical protein A370_04218 [Clostridium sp. Maddingley MBC34-26]
MNERKLIIIDKTLVVLNQMYGKRLLRRIPQLFELVKLLYKIGSDYIEIPGELSEKLPTLPKEIKIRLSNETEEIISDYNVCNNISKELTLKYKNIRIVGLDDIIFYDYKEIFKNIKESFGGNLEICIKNKYGASTAMSLEWFRAGGEKIVTTFSGIGGFTPLEGILGSIKFLEKIDIRGDYVLFPEVLKLFEEVTEHEIKPNMPFIGKDIFNVESGIHVNGIAKNPSTYEPYDPSKIGRERKIIIGKHSGISSLEIKLKELHIEYACNNLSKMLEEVRKMSTQKKRGLEDKEIKEIYMKCSNLC